MESDISILNDLIEITLDSADGYAEAAEEAGSSRFKSLFASRGAERRALVRQLQEAVRIQGGTPADDGSLLAAAHRRFLDLRHALSNGDRAIIEEVERGEDHIKAKYEKALAEEALSADVRRTILRAYESVRAGHDQARDLKVSGSAGRSTAGRM